MGIFTKKKYKEPALATEKGMRLTMESLKWINDDPEFKKTLELK